MKKFNYTALTRHPEVLENHYDKMVQYLVAISPDFRDLLKYLKPKMTSCYSAGNCILLNYNELVNRIFFVNKGMIVAFCKDRNSGKMTHTLFVEGQMVVLPGTMGKNEPSFFCLMSCPGTHMIEIPVKDLALAKAVLPKGDSLIEELISRQSHKVYEREIMNELLSEERIIAFFTTFLIVRPFGRTNIIDRDLIASYLSMKKEYLSRLLRQIIKKATEEEARTGIVGPVKWTK